MPPASAREMGHVHLDDVIERADSFHDEAILLTHFSARQRTDEVPRIFERRVPGSSMDRVVPFLPGQPAWSPEEGRRRRAAPCDPGAPG